MTHARRRTLAAVQSSAAQVHVRRAYTDSRHGQLHLATAYPSGGGFDERTPLLCLHAAGSSGSWFRTLLPELGRDRSVYAPDLPGHGHSDPAGEAPGLAEQIAAIGDFLDGMRLRSIDVLGHRFGAQVAAGLAAQRPQQIRRVVLVGLPAGEAGQAAKSRSRATVQSLRASRPVSAGLADINQPALVLAPAGEPVAVEPVHAGHSVAALPYPADALFGTNVPDLARALRSFLDR